MTTKDKMLQAVAQLPGDATIEDGMESFLFLAKVERGLAEADAGRTIPDAEVKRRMGVYLTRRRGTEVPPCS